MLKAKKSYGQHFLNDEGISENIARSLQLTETYHNKVLEVGPGQGMLTKYLISCGYDLTVVEADRDMVAFLKKNYAEPLAGRIISEDFLKLRLNELYDGQFAIIGNFPYNISSQIVFQCVEYRSQVVEMVGMFQKEMAERIIAPPGSKTYGVISVLVQAYFSGEYLFNVRPFSFDPPPNVESGVIRLVRRADYETLGCDENQFRNVVKTAFGSRRKMMRNTLRALVNDDEKLKDPIFNERPEQLSVAQFVALTRLIFNT